MSLYGSNCSLCSRMHSVTTWSNAASSAASSFLSCLDRTSGWYIPSASSSKTHTGSDRRYALTSDGGGPSWSKRT
eukprot:29828-Pelagococcus_subviridis.AAC.3